MAKITTERRASIDEIAAEMDRRGAVIEKLEAEHNAVLARAREFAEVALKNGEALLAVTAERDAAIRQRDQAVEALDKIEATPAWGAPERWETTPAEVRQLARTTLDAIRKEPTDGQA
jgi:hypothetical protein